MAEAGELAAAGVLRPPLKWAWGKRWLTPHLQPIWTPYQDCRLVEPLCGGLAVSLGLMPERALLNDINPHVVNFYRWLQAGLTPVLPMRNEAELYYEYRKQFNALIRDGQADSATAAELFYYLNRTGYNGLCRFNRSGEFNVPFGRHKTITYGTNFADYLTAFAAWDFFCKDFESLALNPTDFIYADPPYDVTFTQYAQGGFGWDDQVRFATWLAHHPGPVVLSNQATGRIVRLYEQLGFTLTYLQAPRRISCNGDRTPAREVLAMRNVMRNA